MKNSKFKMIFVVLSILCGILVCVVGYMKSTKRVEHLKTTISSSSTEENTKIQLQTIIDTQQNTIEELRNQINAFFTDDTQVFLKSDVSSEKLSDINDALHQLKTTLDVLGSEGEAYRETILAQDAEKSAMLATVQTLQNKLTLQDQLNTLFTAAVTNWTEVVNDVVIIKDLTPSNINEVKESLQTFPDDAWKAHASEYITFAEAQLARATAINESFTEMLSQPTTSGKVTREKYQALVESIAIVRNPQLKEEFNEKLKQVAKILENQ